MERDSPPRRRELQQAYGYTHKDLGHCVACSAALIRKIEGGTRRPSRQVTDALLAVATARAPAFPGGVGFVALAPIQDRRWCRR